MLENFSGFYNGTKISGKFQDSDVQECQRINRRKFKNVRNRNLVSMKMAENPEPKGLVDNLINRSR